MKKNRLVLMVMMWIFILSWVVYFPVLKNDFVYDDYWLIVNNEFIFGIKNFKEMFKLENIKSPRGIKSISRPVLLVSYMVDYEVYKLVNSFFKWLKVKSEKLKVANENLKFNSVKEPQLKNDMLLSFVMHWTNIFIHGINSVLVFLLIFKISSMLKVKSVRGVGEIDLVTSFFGSLIFMLHPLQVESVSVVSFRSGMLSLMFGLCGMILFLKILEINNVRKLEVKKLIMANEKGGVGVNSRQLEICMSHKFLEKKYNKFSDKFGVIVLMVLCMMMFGLSILSKETGISFVLTIFCLYMLYNYLSITNFVGEKKSFSLRWILLFLGLLGTSVLCEYWWVRNVKYKFFNLIFVTIVGGKSPLESWVNYFNTIFVSLNHYFVKIFYPVGLSIEYQVRLAESLLNKDFFLFLSLVVVVVVLFFKSLQLKRYDINFGIIFLVISYFPVSNIVPLANTVADRYMYSVIVGIGIIFSGMINYLISRIVNEK